MVFVMQQKEDIKRVIRNSRTPNGLQFDDVIQFTKIALHQDGTAVVRENPGRIPSPETQSPVKLYRTLNNLTWTSWF